MPSKLALINQIHAVLQQQHGGEAIFLFSPQRTISPQRILIKVLNFFYFVGRHIVQEVNQNHPTPVNLTPTLEICFSVCTN